MLYPRYGKLMGEYSADFINDSVIVLHITIYVYFIYPDFKNGNPKTEM
jgi:hypothetical protein